MPPPRDRPPYGPKDLIAGKYAVRQVLGEGGMAVVYAAVDTSCDKQVAVKVLRPGVARANHLSDDQMRSEASILVRLHDRTPHVADVLTAGITDDAHGLPYYVMERLWGTTLRTDIAGKHARAQPFEVIEVASTVAEVATALAHAHQMNVVHRDVKPENVFIAEQRDRAAIAKLLDFGVSALARDEAPEASEAGSFAGSPQYAAPEQLEGGLPTPAVDVYALGLMLFEMLTFTLPHDRLGPGVGAKRIARNVLRERELLIRELRPDAPPLLHDLVARCLSVDPAGRPTALQVVNALRDIGASVERELLGAAEQPKAASTEVDGPPVEVRRRWMGELAVAEVKTEPPPEVHAPPAPSGDHLFFWDADPAQRTAPIPPPTHVTEPIPRPPIQATTEPIPAPPPVIDALPPRTKLPMRMLALSLAASVVVASLAAWRWVQGKPPFAARSVASAAAPATPPAASASR
jgi:serine/threonine protein kinase